MNRPDKYRVVRIKNNKIAQIILTTDDFQEAKRCVILHNIFLANDTNQFALQELIVSSI